MINVIDKGEPIAEFSADKTAGLAPLEVKFTDLSQGNPVSWVWEFGDGGNTSEQNPEHIYQNEGIYTVGLFVGNILGSDWDIKTNLINVQPKGKPVAEFKATPLVGIAPISVQFTDLSQGKPTSWIWEFGDGGISGLKNPLHRYKSAGFYNVLLSVSNFNGTDIKEQINLINVLQTFSGNLPAFSPLTAVPFL